ncbi:MAG: hypothetical protein F6K31_31060, partial [Symploca sp. SIO2G7]|nr:hypothetical protein [Symploca sp. SIO2G7]
FNWLSSGENRLNWLSGETRLEINSEIFTIQRNYLFKGTHQVQGRTEDISEVSRRNITECILWEGIKPHCIHNILYDYKYQKDLLYLHSEDIGWLVAEINSFLKELQS